MPGGQPDRDASAERMPHEDDRPIDLVEHPLLDELLTVAHYGLGQSYMGLRRYATAAKAYRDCLEAFKTLHGLQQSHRFEVERQRDDEIKALNENIRSLTQARAIEIYDDVVRRRRAAQRGAIAH
jgi:hypothetical protein